MGEAQLVIQNIGGVVVVSFGTASMLDTVTIAAVKKQLVELVDQQAHRKLLLDFSRVKLLSSSMLGALIELRKKSDAIKGRVAICGLKPELHKVFKISRLDSLFHFYPSQEEGMKSFDILAKN